MKVPFVIMLMATITWECSSTGFETLFETQPDPRQLEPVSNNIPGANSVPSAQDIPDLKHYISALNQPSVLAGLSELPAKVKKNMGTAFDRIISICGNNHPISMIFLHIQWLLKNSEQVKHSFDRSHKLLDKDHDNESELEVRGLGFNLPPSSLEEIKSEKSDSENTKDVKLNRSRSSKTNPARGTVRDSQIKKVADLKIGTMTV